MSDVSGAGHWRPEVKIIRGKTIYELEGVRRKRISSISRPRRID